MNGFDALNFKNKLLDKDQHIKQQIETKLNNKTTKIIILSFIYMISICTLYIGNLKSMSLAILTDSTHLFSDFIGFILSIISYH